MKLRYADIFIIITGLFCLCMVPDRALAGEEKYLWLEMENAERLGDGSLNLRLNLHYGKFPDKKVSLNGIRDLKAFYIKKSFGEASSGECFKTDIKILDNNCFLNIKSHDENSYTLYVSGITENGPELHYLSAKATFALFGKSSNEDNDDLLANVEDINRKFEILTLPEFHYWPQTGIPLKISAVFDNARAAFRDIYVHDEHNPELKIMSGENGEISYVPPEDCELDREGSTAFKHTIVTVEHSKAGVKYISSRTLIFHRSRYGNYRPSIGAGIFGITITVFFMPMYFIRKRSAF